MDWFLIALVAPLLWAVVSVIDNYFVDGIYEDEFDGIVISAFFQGLPWLLVPIGVLHFSPLGPEIVWAIAAGFSFIAGLFYYFRSLFRINDSALMQILWSLSVPLVPFLAWFIVDEQLSLYHYLGIAIVFLGVTMVNLDFRKGAKRELRGVRLPMACAVLFMAFSMVAARKASLLSPDVETNFLLFCLGGALVLLAVPFLDPQSIRARSLRSWTLLKQYFFVFSAAEGLSVAATFTSQWAIQLAPAISFVAAIESLVPIFIVAISLLVCSSVWLHRNRRLGAVCREQLAHVPVKILATVVVGFGIFLMS